MIKKLVQKTYKNVIHFSTTILINFGPVWGPDHFWPIWLQVGPKLIQIGPKLVQVDSNLLQVGPKLPQNCSKLTQHDPTLA